MRGFSFALGVRCQYCHVGGDGISFEGVEFDKDDDPDKRKARFMLEMVDRLNHEVLARVPDRDDPPTLIECKTCHRGLPKPTLLSREIRRLVDSAGAPAAAAKVKEWRERIGLAGIFDFGEWETNVAAERLERDGRLEDAIGVYQMNSEFYPQSSSITASLGRLYEAVADTASAIEWYERTLELQADHRPARRRLAALQGGN